MTAILKVDTIQDTSGNNIINENANTITIGKSGDTTNIVGTLQNDGAGLVSGITNAQQWRLTSNFTGNADPIASNLEKADSDGAGSIGSDMTESSGVFTFPETGIWLISYQINIYSSTVTTEYVAPYIMTTTNNSTYDTAAQSYANNWTSGSYSSSTSQFIFDVTNTSTHKVRFSVVFQNTTAQVMGDTSKQLTGFTFTRLGDT
tara:strand:+ start:495 stop:1106 length:612 start_codon:yes stop_codon:yes gene_type:complete